jgi:hypothetical protein
MANQITIHELEQTTEVEVNHELAVDDGTKTKRIRVDDFLESSKVNEYKEAAEQAAEDAEDAAELAGERADEIEQQFATAQGYVHQAQEYAASAAQNASVASGAATSAATNASAAENAKDLAVAAADTAEAEALTAKSWARGQTGTRVGEATDNALFHSAMSQTYSENAEYAEARTAQQAHESMMSASEAKVQADTARSYAQEAAYQKNLAANEAQDAADSADAAAASATAAAAESIQAVLATVDNNTGLPSVTVTDVSDLEGKKFKFDFHNLKGDSGIQAQTAGWFTLSVEANGNVYAEYPDGTNPPPLEIDEDGNIYYVTGEDD